MYETLVVSGGSLRGIAHLGVLHYLSENNILKKIKHYMVCSVGALLSTLVIVGYTPKELHDFLKMINFDNLRSFNIGNFLSSFGVEDGKLIIEMIETLIYLKIGIKGITFKQLYEKTEIKLSIITTCLSTKKECCFSHENAPNMPVTTAIRMSISLPIFFLPVLYEGKYYIDGGITNFYPIDRVDGKVLGIVLLDIETAETKIESFEDYIVQLMYCSLNSAYVKNIDTYEKQTIKITTPCLSIYSVLTSTDKEKLFQCGYDCATNFFTNK